MVRQTRSIGDDSPPVIGHRRWGERSSSAGSDNPPPGSDSGADGDVPTGIGRPARRALLAARYDRLDQLAGVDEAELLRLHGVGPKAVAVLRRTLAEMGQAFAVSERRG